MMRLNILLLMLLISTANAYAQKEKPVPIIFDTDMGPDYDDVGAITLLHALADSGKAEILATVASTKYEGVAAVLDVLNTYFNRPDVPIAIPRGKAIMEKDFQHWSDTLQANYPHSIQKNADVPDAVSLYRQILSQQPDTSVTVITVGFLTNIADLLKSKADDHSSLSGKELVKKKVKKLVSMAGRFPTGKEFNIEQDAASAKYAFENFPRPVIYSGFEIGEKIKSGIPLINNDTIQNSPVKDVYHISINMREEDKHGRMSWDQTAVLAGVLGVEPFYDVEYGRISIGKDGTNVWDTKRKGHARLAEKASPQTVELLINKLMMHQPVRGGN